ncbi:MAG: hypothetical protein U9Q83_03765 [Bacteroidota bacterium]|nr:hypothetical protein [Bacteroidota bacterium]
MAQNINATDVLEITPEIKEMLKKNYFFVNKVKFPSFFAASVMMAYMFIGIAIFVVFYFRPVLTTYIFAAILVTVAFFYTFKWIKPYYSQKQKFALRPTSDQIENWFVKDIREIVKPAAIEMLSLNPATITPDNFIVVPHPVWWEVPAVPIEYIARYHNGEYNVYATHNIQVIALTENYISYYRCTYDWLSNEIVNPYTLEFFFDDISSIRGELTLIENTPIDYEEEVYETEDEDEQVEPDAPPPVGSARTVIVRNKSGEAMEIIVNISVLDQSPRITLKSEKIMQTLRIMLRQRRYGEEFEIIRPEIDEHDEDLHKEE